LNFSFELVLFSELLIDSELSESFITTNVSCRLNDALTAVAM